MPCSHGKTREEAIHNGEKVIEMCLAAWEAEGESSPEPRTLQIAWDRDYLATLNTKPLRS